MVREDSSEEVTFEKRLDEVSERSWRRAPRKKTEVLRPRCENRTGREPGSSGSRDKRSTEAQGVVESSTGPWNQAEKVLEGRNV